MDFPQDVLHRMQSCEDDLSEIVSAGRLVHYPELLSTVDSIEKVVKLERNEVPFHIRDATFSKWLCGIVDLLDLSCQETQVKSAELSANLEASGYELESAPFHRVANLLFFKCFLFGARVHALTESQGELTEGRLIVREKYSKMFQKWDQGACESALQEWTYCNDTVENSDLAKRILYQWTHIMLESVDKLVNDKMVGYESGGGYVEAAKLGGEVCDFLNEYDTYLDPKETEFLHDRFYRYFTRTARLRKKLGEYEKANELCEGLLRKLDRVLEYSDIMIPIRSKGEIVYCQPDARVTLRRKEVTLKLILECLQGQKLNTDYYLAKYEENRKEITRFQARTQEIANAPEKSVLPYVSQLTQMQSLIQEEKYSEAEMIFERYKEGMMANEESAADPQRWGLLRDWLIYCFEGMIHEYYPLCMDYSNSEWQSVCWKYELVLDMSEFVGDPMLTAELLKQYGHLMGERSLYKIKSLKGRKEFALCDEDYTGTLHRWVKEELGVPITTMEDVEAVKTCFREPYCPGEHKNHRPPMLKAWRLLKGYVDTYSRLLHNWTKGSSADETGWLTLLESQKWAHEALQEYLLLIVQYWIESIRARLQSRAQSSNSLPSNHASLDVNVPGFRMTDDGFFYDSMDIPGTGSGTGSKEMFNDLALKIVISSALVWAERGRARSLLHQLGAAYTGLRDHSNLDTIRDELIKFDLDDEAALASINSCGPSACEGAVFVEYVHSAYYNSAACVTYDGIGDPDSGFHMAEFLCDEKRVEQLVGDFYKAVNPGKDGMVKYDARLVAGYLEELYDILIEPIWFLVTKGLRAKSTLVFVPDKILNRVPFALLRDRKSQKYLFELYPISVAPSLRVLQHCKRRLSYLEGCPSKPGNCILAVGGASYTAPVVVLPGTQKEVTDLADRRFQGRVCKLEKCDATRAKLLELLEESSNSKEKYAFEFMHLGVHCQWDNTYKTGAIQFAKPSLAAGESYNPGSCTEIASNCRGESAIHSSVFELEARATASSGSERLHGVFGEVGVLTRTGAFESTSGATEDMLQSEDIIANGLQWPTRLVVLSACNSSKGQVFGDGEVNLPRALMIAGVPTTLVAQWKVVDEASPELMRIFYDNLQRGQDVATALQSTMLHAVEVHKSNSASKIHEWGPFVIWGLPNVQLPKELWTEDARIALGPRLLKMSISSYGREVIMSDVLKMQNFLASTDNWTFEIIYDAILAALRLTLAFDPVLDSDKCAAIEQVFRRVPLDHLCKAEYQLEHSEPDLMHFYPQLLVRFRCLMRYTQAMEGNLEVALDYADVLIKNNPGNAMGIHRLERAVILRLLGNYVEALREFDSLLELEVNFERLFERSCVKFLMGDKQGALEDLRHARLVLPDSSEPGHYPLLLPMKALPRVYCEWIQDVFNDEVSTTPSGEIIEIRERV